MDDSGPFRSETVFVGSDPEPIGLLVAFSPDDGRYGAVAGAMDLPVMNFAGRRWVASMALIAIEALGELARRGKVGPGPWLAASREASLVRALIADRWTADDLAEAKHLVAAAPGTTDSAALSMFFELLQQSM